MMLMDVKPEIKSEDSETAEINALAQQIKTFHDKLRSDSVPVQPADVATRMTQLEKAAKDTSSSLANFGWETFPNRPVFPFVRRGSKCFVANQICRKLIFSDIYKKFSLYTTDCLPVDILGMTQSEAAVFNEINIIHCDKSLVGDHCFREGEPMTDLQDVKKSFKFFETCENTMISKIFENDLFGFIKIAEENEVPFVWSGCKKLVPLFYFEGQSEYLDSRSINLTDKWKLGYLRFCCLVQNIRKDLYNTSSLKVVDIEDVKKLFPENTSFELCWPEESNQDLLAPEVRVAELHGLRGINIPTAGVSPISHFQQVPNSYVASQKDIAAPGVSIGYSSVNQELLAPSGKFVDFYGVRGNSIPSGMPPVPHFQQVPDRYVAPQRSVASPGVPARYSSLNLHQNQCLDISTVPYPCCTTKQSSEKIGNVRLANDNRANGNLTSRKRRSTDQPTSAAGKVKRRNLKGSRQNTSAPAIGNIRDELLSNHQNRVMVAVPSPSVSRTKTTNVPYRSPQTASSPELRLHSPIMSEAATSRQFTHDNFNANYTPISIHPNTNPIWQYSRTEQQQKLPQSFPTAMSPPQVNTIMSQNYQHVAYLQSSTQRPPPVAPSQTAVGVSICSTPLCKSTLQTQAIDSQSTSEILDHLSSLLAPSQKGGIPQDFSSVYSRSVSRNPNTIPSANTLEVTSTSPNNFPSVMCHQSPTSTFQRSICNNGVITQHNSVHLPSTHPGAAPYGTSTALPQNFSSTAITQSAAGYPQRPTNNSTTNQTVVADRITLRRKISEFLIKNINLVDLIKTDNGIKDFVWSFMLEQQMTSVKQQKELGPLIRSEIQDLFTLLKQSSLTSVNGLHQQKAPTLGGNSYELSSQTIQNVNVTNIIQITNNNQQLGYNPNSNI